MHPIVERIFIGYGSESGNARGLAQTLERLPFLEPYSVIVQELNSLTLGQITAQDRLVIVSSSFGDGEPPANAERFLDQICQTGALAGLQYAIFGLGDTAYPTFCGFTKAIDAALLGKKAIPFINRVDADTDFEEFFKVWSAAFNAVLRGNSRAGSTLRLQVTAYGENDAYPARVISQTRLSTTPPYAYHIRFDIEGSGITYRAGDNLYVLPENDPLLLSQIAQWFGGEQAGTALADRELRQISKATLRDIAKATQNEALKTLLKISSRKLLDEYLYGKDILDVLCDFCEPRNFGPQELANWLPQRLPRAYSIASHNNDNYVDLCVREIAYSLANRERKGTATGYLTSHKPVVKVFARSNPRFHLPRDVSHPLIMVGTGTGIAPLIALLEQLDQERINTHACLVFGERREASDFLYRERIEQWRDRGVLDQLITAFSRDSDSRYYVQHAIIKHGTYIWGLLQQGAHLYLCGNKANLERAIDEALIGIAISIGGLTAEEASEFVSQLLLSNRIHKELY